MDNPSDISPSKWKESLTRFAEGESPYERLAPGSFSTLNPLMKEPSMSRDLRSILKHFHTTLDRFRF
jgi:hypothetical protein